MPNPSIDDQIRARITSFVEELSTLVREAALEAVEEVLGQGGSPAASRSSARKTPRRKAAKKAAKRKTARRKTSGKRVRRSADDIAEIGERVLAYVKANPGTRMEAIGKALRKDTKDLRRSVQELIAAKKLRTKGQKRGTEYYAGAGGAGRKAARRTTAKKKTARKTKKKATRKARKKTTRRKTKKTA